MSNLQQAPTTLASQPSFVDLRQFARDETQGIPTTASADDDRFLSSRRILDWAQGPVTAGVIALEGGSGSVHSLPEDEFIIVNQGNVTLSQQDFTLTLEPGQSAVLEKGATFSWSAQGPVSLIFTRYNDSQLGNRSIVPIRENPQLEATGTPPAELLLTPVPVCRNHTDYRSANGEFVCGTWDSTPYQRRAMFYRHFELMYLLEGTVTLVDEAGRRGTFSKGDIFLVEQTAQCTWESRERVAKVYVIYRPAQ
ncbi:cupin domain-containing protein [Polaromonas jejuensis]|uniref:Cupin domain-containing protein n=1 Tax=Polaromonas jejuensis TaxID=457502 RepID=A0ABW0QGR9_9BURK|nr:cupin domain-containing protein [Polaromonas jejuensis]